MKLNIYDKKKIVKTYSVDTYDLMWGVVEDVANAIKLDELKTGNQDEIIKLVANFVVSGSVTVNYLLKDIFDGITDEELRCVRVSEIVTVLVDVVKFTIAQLGKMTEKN